MTKRGHQNIRQDKLLSLTRHQVGPLQSTIQHTRAGYSVQLSILQC